jgi:hypothetical protein
MDDLDLDIDSYSIEVTYTVMGFDEAGETTFEMDVSEKMYDTLQEADDEGELLDSEYISENHRNIHRKILKAIRENMEEESWDSEDGTIEKRLPWGATFREDCPGASHAEMLNEAEDDDIEYSIELF